MIDVEGSPEPGNDEYERFEHLAQKLVHTPKPETPLPADAGGEPADGSSHGEGES